MTWTVQCDDCGGESVRGGFFCDKCYGTGQVVISTFREKMRYNFLVVAFLLGIVVAVFIWSGVLWRAGAWFFHGMGQ